MDIAKENIDNEETPSGEEVIFINFKTNFSKIFTININNKTPLNETLKAFAKLMNIPENLIDEFIFITNGNKLDNKSNKTLSEYGIKDNQTILINYNNDDSHEVTKLINLKKNICVIHNKKLTFKCNQCNFEICDQCKLNHKCHSIEKLDNKNLSYKKDIEEFENCIMNNENKKRIIFEKVKKNINWFENYNKEEKDVKDEINSSIEKMLKQFYSDLETGQNLLLFSQILFATYIKMDKTDIKIEIYKKIINQINHFFNEEKIKEYDLNNFPLHIDFKDISKCIYKSNYNFIPQIKLKFNDVKEIDKEIIDSLINKCKEIFKDKNVNIIEIKKGSLSVIIALNYLIKEKLETMDMENKKLLDILNELNNYIGIETNNIANILKNNVTIAQKDRIFKPDFAKENLYDLESSTDELFKSIVENKKKNCDTNIYEISKSISGNDLKNFFNSLAEETKETQDNLYNQILDDANKELENYLEIFDAQYEEALKKSIFEYNTKYIAYIYRHDEKYNSGKLRCNNVESKILFHGTNSKCISLILASQFKESGGDNKKNSAIFGPGIYFSDLLDYTWYYADDSGKQGSRDNFNRIPKINESFSFIVSNVYYDKDKFEQVYDNSTMHIKVPENGIRHILVDYRSAAIPKNQLNNYNKFKGTEYLIPNKNQILPLLSVTVERVKYLIVWRDANFNSSNPNNYSEFEKMLAYNYEIKNYASFNLKTKIYYFSESNEALEFIKRKKYNKIILISNGGNNGCDFIEKARKIIGNNTISMITCYVAKKYLKEVQKMENVLLNSKYCDCLKDFLKIVYNENIKEMKNLQKTIENKYQELDKSFNFKQINKNAFKFPKFKEGGKFEELDFTDSIEKNSPDNTSNCLII